MPSGDAFGFTYNGEEYYYIKNVQNDIVAIADKKRRYSCKLLLRCLG